MLASFFTDGNILRSITHLCQLRLCHKANKAEHEQSDGTLSAQIYARRCIVSGHSLDRKEQNVLSEHAECCESKCPVVQATCRILGVTCARHVALRGASFVSSTI